MAREKKKSCSVRRGERIKTSSTTNQRSNTGTKNLLALLIKSINTYRTRKGEVQKTVRRTNHSFINNITYYNNNQMRTLGPTNLLRILAGFKSNGFDFSKQRGVTKEKGCKRIPERVITEKDFNLEVLDETVRSFQRFVLFCSLFHTRHTNATKTQIRKRREGEGEKWVVRLYRDRYKTNGFKV